MTQLEDTARKGRMLKAIKAVQARHRGHAARKQYSLMRQASCAAMSALEINGDDASTLSITSGGLMSGLLVCFFAVLAVSDEMQGCVAAGFRGSLDEDVSMVITLVLSGALVYRAAASGCAHTVAWMVAKLQAVGEHYEAILGLIVFWHVVYPNVFQSFVDKRIRELIELDCGATKAWCPWEIRDEVHALERFALISHQFPM